MSSIEALIRSKQYDQALTKINSRLQESPNDSALLLQRSVVLTRLSKFTEALADADRAARLSDYNPESQLRRAVNLWRLDKKKEAQALIPEFDDSFEAQTWKALMDPRQSAPTATPKSATPSDTSRSDTPKSGQPTLRTDWYQSNSQVTLSVYRKNVDPQTLVEISAHEIRIALPDHEFVQPLNRINVSQSSYQISPYKIEFVLAKAEPCVWKSLTELKSNPPPTVPSQAPALTAQYAKWDQINGSDDEESGDPMDFFQKLYSNADDATKRAMLKSYTESNGTALSTDWSQVGQQKVEPVPPASMEAKKF